MSYETVGTPGSDSEYFAEDYDRVHCKHGRFIGYPGGADFICPECEDGLDTLEKYTRYDVQFHRKGEWWPEGETIGYAYSEQQLEEKYGELLELALDKDECWFEVVESTQYRWV